MSQCLLESHTEEENVCCVSVHLNTVGLHAFCFRGAFGSCVSQRRPIHEVSTITRLKEEKHSE